MTHQEIREKFRKFFESKGHKWVESSSLLPNDPSVLFTTAGMQQFKPYYVGAADPIKDFGSLNTASIQKCVRTSDIDEVGDERHLTFFEMLGNFSFGGYFKKEAITWAHEFITSPEWMGLKIDYVTVFEGEEGVPADTDSEEIWKSLDPNIVVKKFGRADNFWGPTGDEGPCGPTTEIYVDGIEIWNVVFNQYYQNKDKTLKPLETPGIDTGMGLERLVMVVQRKERDVSTIFETDLFSSMFGFLPQDFDERTSRIMCDHARATTFLVADGVIPSNKDRGSILRRIMRTIMTFDSLSDFNPIGLLEDVVRNYKGLYPNLSLEKISTEWQKEEREFSKVLATTEELEKTLQRYKLKLESEPGTPINITTQVVAGIIFDFRQSKGLPFEISIPISVNSGILIDKDQLKREEESFLAKHVSVSSAGAEKKFGGHGLILDTGELKASTPEEMEKVIKLHTSTHLLHASLRKVLGEEVHQAGSDITAERLRFDFTFSRKLTPEEISQVEELVNGAIQKDYTVTKEEMPYEEAVKTGALSFFKLKYPPMVNVYSVGDFSKELCGGPHVEHTGIIGTFKITKEEAVSAGVRRIRATIQ